MQTLVASPSIAQPIFEVFTILGGKLWPFVVGIVVFTAIKSAVMKFTKLGK